MPSLDTLRDEQMSDPEVTALRQYLTVGRAIDPVDSDALRRASWLARETCPSENGQFVRRVFLKDDVLYRRITPDRACPYVPVSLRSAVLTAFHDQLGHPLASRLTNLIRSRFYWPNLSADAQQHVKECHHCTLSKPGIRPRRSVGPTIGHYPFDVVFADICDMANTHDYDPSAKTGFRKMIVFVDSLSRWVEAIPLHSDPPSEQVLDIFAEHVLCRHGAPRRVISDSGSNLSGKLCTAVMESCGVDLRPTSADHHEAAGTVERFQSTLISMARASDEGGRYWPDHLPFLLMSYRATPHRVTAASPAMLLYGRELRLPSQMTSEPVDAAMPLSGDDVQQYALRLHRRLAYAWRAARDATVEQQSKQIRDAEQRTSGSNLRPPNSYNVGDRVVRYLHDHPNKLQYVYAGPYRVEADLGDGRYRLRDLENNMVKADINASNLRPYHAKVDAEDLQDDEYLVERLLDKRHRAGLTEYLVKWRGFPRSQATWEHRKELDRRCAELLTEFDSAHSKPRRQPLGPARTNAPAVPLPVPPVAPAPPVVDVVDEHLPTEAKFERGQWLYGRIVTSPRGSRLRFYPAANFTQKEIQSPHFAALRSRVSAALTSDPDVAAAFQAVALTDTAVWFATLRHSKPHLLSYVQPESSPSEPSFDTFSGPLIHADNGDAGTGAYRSVRKHVKLHATWCDDFHLALASEPMGHWTVDLPALPPAPMLQRRMAAWLVEVPASRAYPLPIPSKTAPVPFRSDSLNWRPADDVLSTIRDPAARSALRLAVEALYPDSDSDPVPSTLRPTAKLFVPLASLPQESAPSPPSSRPTLSAEDSDACEHGADHPSA